MEHAEKSSNELNLIDRDPLDVNAHVKVEWSEIFAEPNDLKSYDCIWKYSHKTFRGTKWFCYNGLTAICFLPISVFWGLCFASLSFTHIWCLTPVHRSLLMTCHLLKNLMTILLDATLAPLFSVISLLCSNYRFSYRYENPPLKYEV